MKLVWIIDIDIMDAKHHGAIKHLRNLGYEVITVSATKDVPTLSQDPDIIYTYLGSFEGLRPLQKQRWIATYGMGDSILRTHYTSNMPLDWFLNSDDYLTTWGRHCSGLRDNKIHERFIRPDSGKKIFTGQVFPSDMKMLESEIEFMNRYSGCQPETLIWVSSPKIIQEEYRFWISNTKIVGMSEYSWVEDFSIQNNPPKEMIEFAQEVANYKWQPDDLYTLDLTMYDDYPHIIEFNSFSCAGLYDCDATSMLEQVTKDIQAECSK